MGPMQRLLVSLSVLCALALSACGRTETPTLPAVTVASASPDATVEPPPPLADAGATDAPTCGHAGRGTCPGDESCISCSQPARTVFFCAPPCRSEADCVDPARPSCEGAPAAGEQGSGFCAVQGTLQRCRSKCAAPDTPVLTPSGERPIASLRPGDLVLSVDRGRLTAVSILAVGRTPVADHSAVHVTLASGARLLMSPDHPLPGGRTFGALAPGDRLGAEIVSQVALEPYPFDATYDILPDSDTHTYLAAGVLVGSTL